MARIRVSVVIPASPRQVWDDVRNISSHVEWMTDALAIRFTSERRSGTGEAFDCDTRVGPFRMTDRMEITDWEEGRMIGIRHVGWVRGTGRFTLRPARHGRTRFTWQERLQFPWWMGGPAGALVAAPIMRRIWRGNLANLRQRFE